jgi:hypothetical protein
MTATTRVSLVSLTGCILASACIVAAGGVLALGKAAAQEAAPLPACVDRRGGPAETADGLPTQKGIGQLHESQETAAGKHWFAHFQLYAPTEANFDGSWPLPEIAATGGIVGSR